MRSTPTKIEVFSSFEEENAAEHRRLAAMSPDERCEEMAVLQERVWGSQWTSTPIEKVACWEELSW